LPSIPQFQIPLLIVQTSIWRASGNFRAPSAPAKHQQRFLSFSHSGRVNETRLNSTLMRPIDVRLRAWSQHRARGSFRNPQRHRKQIRTQELHDLRLTDEYVEVAIAAADENEEHEELAPQEIARATTPPHCLTCSVRARTTVSARTWRDKFLPSAPRRRGNPLLVLVSSESHVVPGILPAAKVSCHDSPRPWRSPVRSLRWPEFNATFGHRGRSSWTFADRMGRTGVFTRIFNARTRAHCSRGAITWHLALRADGARVTARRVETTSSSSTSMLD